MSRRPKVGERIHPPRGISIGESIDALDRSDYLAICSPIAPALPLIFRTTLKASKPGANLRLEIGSSFTDVGILETSGRSCSNCSCLSRRRQQQPHPLKRTGALTCALLFTKVNIDDDDEDNDSDDEEEP